MSGTQWFDHVQQVAPGAKALYLSVNREEFLDAAERLVGAVVERMEASKATFRKLNEPDLSNMVKEMLGPLVPSEAESHSNGHVDVTIRHPRGMPYRHLTECKIWNGQKWHRDGMKQLLGYAGGREGRVLCLAFFIRHKRMTFLLERLRAVLETATDPPSTGAALDHPALSGAFATQHEHASGAALAIVHLGCHLWEEGCEDLSDEAD